MRDPVSAAADSFATLLDKVATTARAAPPTNTLARDLATSAFEGAGGSTKDKYEAARGAVVAAIAGNDKQSRDRASAVFDQAHSAKTNAAPSAATATTVADAADSALAEFAKGEFAANLTLSSPSMLGTSARATFAAIAAALAFLAGLAIFRLASHGKPTTATFVGLTVELSTAMLSLVLFVMGYGNVSISTGPSPAKAAAPTGNTGETQDKSGGA